MIMYVYFIITCIIIYSYNIRFQYQEWRSDKDWFPFQ